MLFIQEYIFNCPRIYPGDKKVKEILALATLENIHLIQSKKVIRSLKLRITFFILNPCVNMFSILNYHPIRIPKFFFQNNFFTTS